MSKYVSKQVIRRQQVSKQVVISGKPIFNPHDAIESFYAYFVTLYRTIRCPTSSHFEIIM